MRHHTPTAVEYDSQIDPPQRNFLGMSELVYFFFVFGLFLAIFDFVFKAFAVDFFLAVTDFFCGRNFKAECAAARRAIGTRKGEHET